MKIKHALALVALATTSLTASADDTKVAYLFTYFNSNDPRDEQICYALSDDGYNYTPLNNGYPVISSDTIAFTQCVRDPHILRGEDGKTFYMVVTDMKSSLGWASNRGMVLMKSTDLINWTHSVINFPTKYPKSWKNVTRVWAPETIYDHKAGKYMVFYSLLSSTGGYDKIYYQYANEDFTDLEGEPKYLFDGGSATIDGDIVYNDADQMYHLFYKNEAGRGIYQAVAKNLTDKWEKIPGNVEQTKESVEGVGVCRSLDGKSWIVMYDCYGNGHYQFCSSEDLKTFKFVQNTQLKGKFTPRHGTIIPITQEEKDRLLKEFPNTKQPILTGFHADPEVLYSNKTGKYYIYSTTDGRPGWGGHDFSVFSSENLVDWKDEGKMLDVKTDQVPWATGNAWAPCIIERKQKDGSYKYYFYFSAHNPKTNRKEISVAIADDPLGPFQALDHPIVTDQDRPEGVRGGQAIDVDVFQDPKSGKFYLYWGNGFAAGAELNDDMCSIKKETTVNLTPKGGNLQTWAYREGTYVIYRKGTYYMMWSVDDTGSPNYHVCYATAKNPLGPYTIDENNYMVIKQRPEDKIYGTAHNSVVQVPGKDEWYIVYHRINKHFIDDRQAGGPGVHREVCIDKLTFDKKGNIIPVVPTVNGPAPLAPAKKK